MAPNAPPPIVRRMFALLNDGGVGGTRQRQKRLAVCSFVTWRAIGSTDDMSEPDIRAVVASLEYWKSCGDIEYRCRRIADKLQGVTTQ